MKSVKVVQILIDRDPMTKISKEIFAWELPVYEEKFTLRVIGESSVDADDLPEAREEFSRMQDFFGQEKDTGQSIVGLVYGRGSEGVAKLEKAINAAHRNAGKPSKIVDQSEAETAGADDALADPDETGKKKAK